VTARLQIRPSVYRDREGFSITGRDGVGHRISIFTETRSSAEHIRRKVRAGEETTLSDFEPQETTA
jgi:hypothetical protein